MQPKLGLTLRTAHMDVHGLAGIALVRVEKETKILVSEHDGHGSLHPGCFGLWSGLSQIPCAESLPVEPSSYISLPNLATLSPCLTAQRPAPPVPCLSGRGISRALTAFQLAHQFRACRTQFTHRVVDGGLNRCNTCLYIQFRRSSVIWRSNMARMPVGMPAVPFNTFSCASNACNRALHASGSIGFSLNCPKVHDAHCRITRTDAF